MSHFHGKIAAIFGGSGFIGTQIVRELASLGYTIKVASRVPQSAYFLRPCGVVGQIVPVGYDPAEPDAIADLIKGADVVVNCVGILYQKKKDGFDKAHRALPEAIAKACKKHKIGHFVHISALGADRGTSEYAKSKLAGEKAILKAYPQATILRPSVVFGHNDNFFNMFARLSMLSPALPLIGGGKTKFQPVFVGNVADAVIQALTDKANEAQGQIYELGGPEVLSFREIYETLFRYTGRRRALVSLPWAFAKTQAHILKLMPTPLLTPDQVESLKTDNVVHDKAKTLEDLGITPTALDLILPEYLGIYRSGGRRAMARQA